MSDPFTRCTRGPWLPTRTDPPQVIGYLGVRVPANSADARLIASAPALLFALHDAERYLRDLSERHGTEQCGLLADVRAAIAEAEGRDE